MSERFATPPATTEEATLRRDDRRARAPSVDEQLLCSCMGCYTDRRRRARAQTH